MGTCILCGRKQSTYLTGPCDRCLAVMARNREATTPTLQVLPEITQRSSDWFAQRRGIITASAIGSLITTRKLGAIDFGCPDCGAQPAEPCKAKRGGGTIKTLHPERAEHARNQPSATVIEPASNDTSRTLTASLAAERITGHTEPTWISDDMQRGIDDEPVARDLYSKHHAPVTEVGFMVRSEWGCRIGYSPDGLVGDDGLIEIKSRRQKGQLQTIVSGAIPAEHMAQLQCGLLVSGRKWIDYVSYSGGMALWTKRVHPQQAWRDALIGAARAFEENAAEMVRIYEESVVGLPMTERIEIIDLLGLG